MKRSKPNNLDEKMSPKVVDIIPAGALAAVGIEQSVPVMEVYRPADQRKWCVAVHEWLERATILTRGCPTQDLIEGGRCQRSPNDGKCLLLLHFDHPDWRPALKEEFDTDEQIFRWREEPLTAPVGRTPLSIEEVGGWGG